MKYLNEEIKFNQINTKYKEDIHILCNGFIEVSQKILDTRTPGSKKYEYDLKHLTIVKNLEITLDHFVMIQYSDDDFDNIYNSDEDPDFDDYYFSYSTLKSIEGDLQNGIYKSIFEKNTSDINKQKMRIRAYL